MTNKALLREIHRDNKAINRNLQRLANIGLFGKYKCRIICHSQEEITIEGIYDCDGVPENWADFINAIRDFLKGYERRELFNTEHF